MSLYYFLCVSLLAEMYGNPAVPFTKSFDTAADSPAMLKYFSSYCYTITAIF